MKKLLLAAIMYLKLLKREVRFLFRSKEVVNLTSPETPSTSSTRMTRITRDNISPDPVSYSVKTYVQSLYIFVCYSTDSLNIHARWLGQRQHV